MIFESSFGTIVNVLIFISLGFSSYVVFYFSSRYEKNKQVGLSVLILSLGLTLIGLSHIFMIGVGSDTTMHPAVGFSALAGALLTFVGFTVVFYKKSVEIITIKNRHREIQEVIANLKEKFYKQEISEEDLRDVNKGLIKELAELEVKLKDSEDKEPEHNHENNLEKPKK